jgi:hypothetical protein
VAPLAYGPAMQVDQLAYDASQRTLDKQERVVEELRGRTGTLLAAAALAVSLLGGATLQASTSRGAVVVVLGVFGVTVLSCLRTLSPAPELRFTLSGGWVLDRAHQPLLDPVELSHQLVADLETFARHNERTIRRLRRSYRLATTSFVANMALLATITAWSNL